MKFQQHAFACSPLLYYAAAAHLAAFVHDSPLLVMPFPFNLSLNSYPFIVSRQFPFLLNQHVLSSKGQLLLPGMLRPLTVLSLLVDSPTQKQSLSTLLPYFLVFELEALFADFPVWKVSIWFPPTAILPSATYGINSKCSWCQYGKIIVWAGKFSIYISITLFRLESYSEL